MDFKAPAVLPSDYKSGASMFCRETLLYPPMPTASCAEAFPLLLAGFGKIWSTGFYEVFEGGQFLLGLASYFLLEEGK
jgi:hypothetical protein